MSVADHTVSPIPREARPYQGLRAGVITRVAAAAVDCVVVALVLGGAYAAVAGFLFLLNPRSFSFPDTSVLLRYDRGHRGLDPLPRAVAGRWTAVRTAATCSGCAW